MAALGLDCGRSLKGRVAIVGVGATPVGRIPDKSALQLSLDATEAALKSSGIGLSRPRKEGRGVDGNRGMWIEDPDGNRIEIMEMAPDCIQHQALARIRAGKPPEALALY